MKSVTPDVILAKNKLLNILKPNISELHFGLYKFLNYKKERIDKLINKEIEDKINNYLDKLYSANASYNLKANIYNDLYRFFSNFYEDGDFVPKKTYEVEETNDKDVKLFWIYRDMYFVQTLPYFRDKTFSICGYNVNFKVVDAQVEKGGNKELVDRFFIIDENNPVQVKERDITVNFKYRMLNPDENKLYGISKESKTAKQKKINEYTLKTITLELIKNKFDDREIACVCNKKMLTQLNNFTRLIKKDFLIHKNLKAFLIEQLEYFVKTEIAKDILNENDEKKITDIITYSKFFREIARNIIDVLGEIEDIQKGLWEAKRNVIRTEYVITLDRIKEWCGEEFYNYVIHEVLNNKEQLEEWKRLGFLDDIKKKLKK